MKILRVMWAFVVAGCAGGPEVYRNETPVFDFMSYFSAPVDGWGVVYDWRGRVVERFHVLMDGKLAGTAGERRLRLDETFTYADGRVQERYWEVWDAGVGRLEARAPDVPGGAEGRFAGNSIRFDYLFEMPYRGGSIRLRMDDQMWLVTPEVLMNRVQMSKFGVPVGELIMTFRKR